MIDLSFLYIRQKFFLQLLVLDVCGAIIYIYRRPKLKIFQHNGLLK